MDREKILDRVTSRLGISPDYWPIGMWRKEFSSDELDTLVPYYLEKRYRAYSMDLEDEDGEYVEWNISEEEFSSNEGQLIHPEYGELNVSSMDFYYSGTNKLGKAIYDKKYPNSDRKFLEDIAEYISGSMGEEHVSRLIKIANDMPVHQRTVVEKEKALLNIIQETNKLVKKHESSLKDAGEKQQQEAIAYLDDLLAVMEKHGADIYCVGDLYNISLKNSCLVGVDIRHLCRDHLKELREDVAEGKKIAKER